MALLDVPVIDTHVHLWDKDNFRVSWIDGNPTLDRQYGLAEFDQHSREVAPEGFVFVEAGIDPHYAFLEAGWVAGLARQDSRLKGIVAAAPLEDGAHTRHYLDRLAAIGPVVKGIRRLLQGEADPFFCLQPAFIEGVKMLPAYGFSFDICIINHQLPGAIELVRRCPEVNFVLDHIAKPNIKAGELDPWRQNLAELAGLPNVACKVSGLVTEADFENWTEAGLAPYVAHVLEVFGEDRVMFGSDWPVAYQATTYTHWVETLNNLTSHLSPEARRKLWADNARRVYRLED
jgi:L-fuconolactonase